MLGWKRTNPWVALNGYWLTIYGLHCRVGPFNRAWAFCGKGRGNSVPPGVAHGPSGKGHGTPGRAGGKGPPF